jgi:hypothetical protein
VIEILDSSDSDSEEDIPARVSSVKLAKPTSLSSKLALPTVAAAKPEQSESEDEEIDEDETQSHNSSIRDSRSPVIYSQHTNTDPVPVLGLPLPRLESGSEKEDSYKESSGDDSDESEEDDKPYPKWKSTEIEMKPGEEEESEDSESEVQDAEMEDNEEEESEESEAESENEGTEVQVPKSSPPILPAAKTAKVSAPEPSQANHSKASITPEELSVQDEIDQQLTSSMYEARSIVNSSAVSTSSGIRPAFKVGASLSVLNSAKKPLGSNATKSLTAARSFQSPKTNGDEGSDSEEEEEEEEESDEDSTSSSDDEPNKPIASKVAVKSQPNATYSDSSDDESSESEDAKTKAQKELAAMIEGLANGNSQVSLPSSKAHRSSTQQEIKKYGKKGEKKVDQFTRYKFSAPK